MDNNKCKVLMGVGSLEIEKHGYKKNIGWGSISEATAAAVIYSSGVTDKWKSEVDLLHQNKVRIFDPFCGSGTFLLESLIAAIGVPVRLNSVNTFENWPVFDRQAHDKAVSDIQRAMHEALSMRQVSLVGSDISNTQLMNTWANFESIGTLR